MTESQVKSGEPSPESVILDATDLRILRILQSDARRSVRSIAREVNMSPGAITERIAKLESNGVISGYRAEISQQAMGYGLWLFIGLQVEQDIPLLETINALLDIKEVASIHVVTGRWDLMLQVRATDHRHLEHLLLGQIWEIPGFRHGETMLSLRHYEQIMDLAEDRTAAIE